jgi:hypothetical protein
MNCELSKRRNRWPTRIKTGRKIRRTRRTRRIKRTRRIRSSPVRIMRPTPTSNGWGIFFTGRSLSAGGQAALCEFFTPWDGRKRLRKQASALRCAQTCTQEVENSAVQDIIIEAGISPVTQD